MEAYGIHSSINKVLIINREVDPKANHRGPRRRGARLLTREITLTFDQFEYGWTNALDENEARELYDKYHVAGSGVSLVQMGNANLNPWTEAKVDTENPDRGPLLIIDGEKDHTVPWAIADATYKRQKRNPGVTEIVKIPTGPFPDHRPRLARGRRHRPGLRQAAY